MVAIQDRFRVWRGIVQARSSFFCHRTNRCRISVVFLCVSLISFIITANAAAGNKENKMDLSSMTTYDRIVSAQQRGEISTKESVLLRAKLLFAPNLLQGSKFAPEKGEQSPSDSLTGFYKDLHKAFLQLSHEESELLRSFGPDLRAIIDQNRKENDKNMPSPGR